MTLPSWLGFSRKKASSPSLLGETPEAREARLRADVEKLARGRPEWSLGEVSSRRDELHDGETIEERNDVKRFRARKALEARWAEELGARLAREAEIDRIERAAGSGALEAARLRCHNEACEIAVRADGKVLSADEARRFPYCLGCDCEIAPAARG